MPFVMMVYSVVIGGGAIPMLGAEPGAMIGPMAMVIGMTLAYFLGLSSHNSTSGL
jgi:hypothetical protein